ncbi:MAG: A/G-specific adenine glycosylase [Gammaproteobacteria bacterium]|nr:A/G-specific adenine glycosylase [Gammaproteobacteria bacterium]
MNDGFAHKVLAWFDSHGRRDLPWQNPATPYRVWVSEIMLQQTQVAKVIPYFERFMQRFPDVAALAAAQQDDVLALWSGLGYYARARNLHHAAQYLVEQYAGAFPGTLDILQTLPGIGRSTAGAILSLSRDAPHAVLDGNVKRVLARYHAVEGWPGTSAVARRLWEISEATLPDKRAGAYNQAMMDLGATLCSRSRPRCGECPVQAGCAAYATQSVARYPGRRDRRPLPVREACMLVLRDAQQGVLLERRAGSGRWGGLWSFPEFASREQALDWVAGEYSNETSASDLEPFRHTFSHFHFDVQPLLVRLLVTPDAVMEGEPRVWYNGGPPPGGLPRPITNLLNELDFPCQTPCTA